MEKGGKKELYPMAPKILRKKAEKLEDKERLDLIQSLSIQQRLMRRLQYNIVKIPFEDDLGVFHIEAPLPKAASSRVGSIRRRVAPINK